MTHARKLRQPWSGGTGLRLAVGLLALPGASSASEQRTVVDHAG